MRKQQKCDKSQRKIIEEKIHWCEHCEEAGHPTLACLSAKSNEKKIDNIVRDICVVGIKHKSEWRRRIVNLLSSQKAELVEKIEGMRKNDKAAGVYKNGEMWLQPQMEGYNQALDDIIKLFTN